MNKISYIKYGALFVFILLFSTGCGSVEQKKTKEINETQNDVIIQDSKIKNDKEELNQQNSDSLTEEKNNDVFGLDENDDSVEENLQNKQSQKNDPVRDDDAQIEEVQNDNIKTNEKENDVSVEQIEENKENEDNNNDFVESENPGKDVEENPSTENTATNETSDNIQEDTTEENSESEEKMTGTEVSGIISQNTTWLYQNSPYIITGNVLVEENATLTIEPGVYIAVDRGVESEEGIPGIYGITVRGTLLAEGTPNNKITFTSLESNPKSKDWTGIKHENIDGVVEISYSNILYAGIVSLTYRDKFNNNRIAYGNYGVVNAGEITNNIIEYNYLGIDTSKIGVSGFRHNIKTNTIRFNARTGLRVKADILAENNTITNNGVGIEMNRNSLGSSVGMNNIFDNTNYNVSCLEQSCEMKQNWWGTADTSAIESKLFDYYDDFNLGKVNYQPILTKKE